MPLRVSLGDQERTITPDELARFEELLQLDRIASGPCSRLLIAVLLLWNEIYRHEPFQVARQLRTLDLKFIFGGRFDGGSPLRPTWLKEKPCVQLYFQAHSADVP